MKTLGTLLIVVGTLFCLTVVGLFPGLVMIGVGALLRIASRPTADVLARARVAEDARIDRLSQHVHTIMKVPGLLIEVVKTKPKSRESVLEQERLARIARNECTRQS